MLGILAHLAALAVVGTVALRGRGWSARQTVLAWGLVPLLLALGLWQVGSALVARKWLGRLLMPPGLLWLLLLVALFFAIRHGTTRQRWAAVGAFVGYWALASNWLASAFLLWLERDYQQRPAKSEAPLEAVLLLGGGTSQRPWGEPQLSPSGDRVATAARLFHRGETRRIVCSGTSIAGLQQSERRSLAADTALLLRELGVPAEVIVQLDGPRNTTEELHAFAGLVRERGWRRLGLVTSAWHMRRSLQAAQQAQVTVVPLAADYRGGAAQWNIVELLPSANGLYRNRLAAWEGLGYLAAAMR